MKSFLDKLNAFTDPIAPALFLAGTVVAGLEQNFLAWMAFLCATCYAAANYCCQQELRRLSKHNEQSPDAQPPVAYQNN